MNLLFFVPNIGVPDKVSVDKVNPIEEDETVTLTCNDPNMPPEGENMFRLRSEHEGMRAEWSRITYTIKSAQFHHMGRWDCLTDWEVRYSGYSLPPFSLTSKSTLKVIQYRLGNIIK